MCTCLIVFFWKILEGQFLNPSLPGPKICNWWPSLDFGSSLCLHCLRYVSHTPTKLPHACSGSSASKQFFELAFLALCLLLKSYMVINPAFHGCSRYLHCSYSGEAGYVHACRFWPNCGVKFGWLVLSTILILDLGLNGKSSN